MVDASEEVFKSIPKNKTKTLTFDNGREFAYHRMIQYLTEIEVYFAQPYCSWQR
jgi:IS30 family transposase